MDFLIEDLDPDDRKALNPGDPLVVEYTRRLEAKYGLPSGLFTAMIVAGENSGPRSGPARNGVSPKGADGLAQLMPGTAKALGVADPRDPVQGLDGGARYAAQMMEQFGPRPDLIAAAYNAGPNRDSLRRGEVPKIPETRAYVDRVKQYMGTNPAVAGAGPTAELPQGLGWEDLTEEDRRALRKQNPDLDPTKDMSTGQRMAAGAGKMLVDTARGTGQLLADAVVNPLSRKLLGRDMIPGMDAAEAERKRLDAPLMDTPGGVAGYVGGALATTAIPGSWLAAAGSKVVPAAAAASRVGPALQAAAGQGAAGAALGALTPVDAPGQRLGNAGAGAGLGAALGAGGAAAAPALQRLADRVNLPPLWRPSWQAQATPTERAAVTGALADDVPVYASQLKTPGSALPPGRAEKQRAAFDRAIMRTMGDEGEDIAGAFARSAERLGATYESLLAGKVIPLGADHLRDLHAVVRFNSSRMPRFAPSPEVDDFAQRAVAAARRSRQMTGREYQEMLSEYKAAMVAMSKGSLDGSKRPDRHGVKAMEKLTDALTKQAERVMSPEELKAFHTANKQWRNMVQLESIAPKTADGNVNPRQLAAALARLRKDEFLRGRGDQTLPDLAKFGNTYMDLGNMAPRSLYQQGKDLAGLGLKTAAITGGEAALIGHQLDHASPEEGVLGKAAPYALGLAAALGINAVGRRALNPRATTAGLRAPRGALGEWAARMQPGGATGMALNALPDEGEE